MYITNLLEDTGFTYCKPTSTPLDRNYKLTKDEEVETVDTKTYQRLIDRLIYLLHTRPYILYLVSVLYHFMHSLNIHHLQAAFRVLRYLKGTIGLGLNFKRNENLNLETDVDADFSRFLVDQRSTTGI